MHHHHTQWAGTFALGAQLSRRHYSVAITLGNTPECDLLCISPGGQSFKIEVKSTNSHNFIRIQKKLMENPVDNNLLLVVVLIPKDLTELEQFFILTHEELRAAWENVPKTKKTGEPLVEGHEGINWGSVSDCENCWRKLPE